MKIPSPPILAKGLKCIFLEFGKSYKLNSSEILLRIATRMNDAKKVTKNSPKNRI